MRRRTVLAAVGTLGVGLAGCVSGGDDGGRAATDTTTRTNAERGTESRLSTTSETATETTITTQTPTLADSTIEAQGSDCGRQVHESEVTFDGDGVVVDGTIWAPNPGHVPAILAADYDGTTDTFSVTVGTEDASDGPVVQCLAEIEYRATAAFVDGLPGSVTVVHETSEGSETVATVETE